MGTFMEESRRKIHHRVSFHRPKNKKPIRRPRYGRFTTCFDKFTTPTVIKYPLTTDSALKKIEDTNTLVFIVDCSSTKRQIKSHLQTLYDIRSSKINTIVRPNADKKAFVKLYCDRDALETANDIGII